MVMEALHKEKLDEMELVSWSAWHANIQNIEIPPAAINGLLPLFLDSAHSVAVIKHSMTPVQSIVQHLNPGQVPVLAADQPLYALSINGAVPLLLERSLCHYVWWFTHRDGYFEGGYLVAIDTGLRFMRFYSQVLGNWLVDSGWTSALVQANIASTGTADSFIKATAASLHTLLHKAYSEFTSEATAAGTEVLSLETWCGMRSQESVQFGYWLKTMSLEITLLLFIRSFREGNFQLYIETLTKIILWMFALDHTHYSRWLPVNIRDMMQLSNKHPAILAEFEAGKFSVHKTRNKFSAIALDQCHEQNNALIKQSGGAVGLTTNSSALKLWMVAGPEVARIVAEFENCALRTHVDMSDHHHHEQYTGIQATFISECVTHCCNRRDGESISRKE